MVARHRRIECKRQLLPVSTNEDLEGSFVGQPQPPPQIFVVVDPAAVDFEHDVAKLNARLLGRGARHNVDHCGLISDTVRLPHHIVEVRVSRSFRMRRPASRAVWSSHRSTPSSWMR